MSIEQDRAPSSPAIEKAVSIVQSRASLLRACRPRGFADQPLHLVVQLTADVRDGGIAELAEQ